MNEHKLIRESDRGRKAREALDNDILVEAWQKVEEGIIEKWKDAPIRDLEGQQTLKLMHKVLAEVKSYVEEVAETGKMADMTLEHERTLAQRARAAVKEFRR